MIIHPTITWLLRTALVAGLCGCGPQFPDGQGPFSPAPGSGKLALIWTLDGAALSAAACQDREIAYMEVEVESLFGRGRLGFTEVKCDLDRYSVAMAPLGDLILRVAAVGMSSRGRACTLLYGEGRTEATDSFPEEPLQIPLREVDGCR